MDPHGAGGVARPPNPRAHASPLSALTFGWVLGTFWRGYKRELEVKDLTEPLAEHRSDVLGDIFEKYWSEEQQRAARRRGARPSLVRVLARVFGVQLALYGLVLAVMEFGLRVAQPIFLGRLVLSFSSESEVSRDAALGYAAGVVLCSIFDVCVVHPFFMGLSHMGMKMRVGSCSLIYRKALRLSKTALGDTTVGQVVNLLANDVARFDLAVIFLHYLWVGPVGTAIVTYIMFCEVGFAALVGVVTVLLFIPLQDLWFEENMVQLNQRPQDGQKMVDETCGNSDSVLLTFLCEEIRDNLRQHNRENIVKMYYFDEDDLLYFLAET